MLKTIFILILIAILAAFGAAAAIKVLSWILGVLINVAIVVLAFLGIMFLIRKLKT